MTSGADQPSPRLPPRIDRLGEIAQDLRWTWNRNARELFRLLDYPLWRRTAHNPVHMLRLVTPERLAEAAAHRPLLELYDRAISDLEGARATGDTWWSEQVGEIPDRCVAYFSAEFALHQSLPIYAGGLGVLAGDICKEASDLGLPFVGVGFMYPQGYFHQQVTADGWQREEYEQIDWDRAPIEPATTPDGARCIVEVPLGTHTIRVGVWGVRLGRTKLYLLDTGLEENDPWDRELSARLYGGDHDTRVQQEIILGMGGVRALRALGADPIVWHLNEGHAAFVALERIEELLTHGQAFDDALAEVRRTTVFTTHTPVPAGHDAFPFSLVEAHLAGCWGPLGPNRGAFLALGHYDTGSGPQFNMTALALRTARERKRRKPGPYPRHPRHVGTDLAGSQLEYGCRGLPSTDTDDHERRAPTNLGRTRDGGALRPVSWRGVANSPRRAGRVGRGRRDTRRRALESSSGAPPLPVCLYSRARA